MAKNKNLPFLIALLAVLGLAFLAVYFLFFQTYFQSFFTAWQSSGNINGKKISLELGYDPLITIVPEELQSEGPQSKFLISQADPQNGLSTAKVILVVWSRFDNLEAKSFSDILKELKNIYADDLLIVWKDLADPSNSAEIGGQAAMAAHCANEQGKFWEYHDKLFANESSLKSENFVKYAEEIGLDATVFSACLDSKSTESIVSSNYYYANNHNITAVPTAYANDEQITEITNLEKIKEIVDKKLASYENTNTSH